MNTLTAPTTYRQRLSIRALAGTFICLAALFLATALAYPASKTPAKSQTWPPAPTAEQAVLLQKVHAIAETLRAPCCPKLTVAQHDSPVTIQMKKDIYDMLEEGKGRGEIVSALKAKYGDAIVPAALVDWKKVALIASPFVLLGLLYLGWTLARRSKEPEVFHIMGEGASEESTHGPEAGGTVKKAS